MNTFLFFRYGIRMLHLFFFLFSRRVQILKTEYNTAVIVLLSANQIVDIFSCKRQCLVSQGVNKKTIKLFS